MPIGNSNLSDFEPCFVLHVSTGTTQATIVSSAILKIDELEILNSSDFSKDGGEFTFEVCDITPTSVITVEIRGEPDSYLDIWIEGRLINNNDHGTFIDDRDGKVYKWIKICDQIWMAENLAYLPIVSPSSSGSLSDPFYYVYGYQGTNVSEAKTTDNYRIYGALYNFQAAKYSCPAGWHLPNDEEWAALSNCLGGDEVAGGKLKEVGLTHWTYPNTGATDESGFTGLPGGVRLVNGLFGSINNECHFWSNTFLNSYPTYSGRDLWYDGTYFPPNDFNTDHGLSVRCIKDSEISDILFEEDFETYSSNIFPYTWTADGNATNVTSNYVDNTIFYHGSQSLKLFGQIGGCWAAIGYHQFSVLPKFTIELFIKNGDENIFGCNPYLGLIGLRYGTSWTNSPLRQLMVFKGDGRIYTGSNKVLGSYNVNQWYKVKIQYERISTTELEVSYWLDDSFLDRETSIITSQEDLLDHFELCSLEGSTWFDYIKIYK